MTQAALPSSNQVELLDALADAEWEMYEAGSRLDMPGDVRFRLLQSAHRAYALIEAAELAIR
jgi:uncharacterized protein YaiE (UPF0345 family)